jgi:hypothetical protein
MIFLAGNGVAERDLTPGASRKMASRQEYILIKINLVTLVLQEGMVGLPKVEASWSENR